MSTSRQQYIDQYAEYAMQQMRRYGIPASVTLAQGIIESANGKSTVATTANNHFGVKGTYNGNYVLADDDRPNEKFKKYDNVAQSYEDHSKVLMANRYQKYTNGLAPDDYKGWVKGIKAGGYASDPRYEGTVVSVIESNNLQRYDKMVMEQMQKEGKKFSVVDNPLSSQTDNSQSQQTQTSNLKSTGMDLPQGQYSMPVKRDEFMLITSPYGKRKDPMDNSKTQIHHGIDIKTKSDAVLATENNGKVISTNHNANTAGGRSVTVEYTREDGGKTQVQYMHLSQITVKQGDTVNAGQKLGVSGNTGTRTTGEHLHFGVINVSQDGKKQWVNPSAYLAEISQKGNIQIQAQSNGKDLLAQYQAGGTPAKEQKPEAEQTPESWMNRLLSSPDAALGLGRGEGQGLTGSLMHLILTLLMLAMQQEGKSKEEKMQALTEAAVNRKIDITSMVSGVQSAELSIGTNGKTILTTSDGKQQFTHEFTEAERTKISQILSSDANDESKKQKIGSLVTAITISQQASRNYEQIDAQQQSKSQEQQASVQR